MMMDYDYEHNPIALFWFEFMLAGPNEGHKLRVEIPLPMLWDIYRAMHEGGPDVVISVLRATFLFADFAEQDNVPHPIAATYTIWSQLFSFFGFDRKKILDPTGRQPADEEYVLEFTYNLLSRRMATHQRAAEVAALLLQRENITENAWRKKVDRWAHRTGKPPVAIYKRGRSEEK